MDVHIGDAVQLSCDTVLVPILDISGDYITTRLPWYQVDPASEFGWDGTRRLPRNPDAGEWLATPFRFQEDPTSFVPGETRPLSIQGIVAYVARVEHFDQPLDVGWLPRPTVSSALLLQGNVPVPFAEDQGFSYNLPGDEFMNVELLFRPYAFLEEGDVILDARGLTWRFSRPWLWEMEGGSGNDAPEWPLTLRSPINPSSSSRRRRISQATRTGSHVDELTRWEQMSHVRPISIEHIANQ
ncbi:hypothetical protein [Nonomuraea sp. NPDC048916]|uniref:hypothetical protein n=1 Tax=Nonomuraea sp. NPDC048916 TaxID=3154232 RepID=UPI0033D59462